MGTSNKGMVLPFQPLSLTFHHMDYYVKLPKVWSAFLYVRAGIAADVLKPQRDPETLLPDCKRCTS